ncbi:MAG TPA: hypothetical protein VGX28_03785 [Frankiaceae bacterium]|nr:hypothetical protein [Frankiaceae bacterium]
MTTVVARVAPVAIALVTVACVEPSPSGRGTASPAPLRTARLTPSPAPSPTLLPREGCSLGLTRNMRVCPASGPEGTVVTIEGVGCSPAADGHVTLSFRNEGWEPGTRGGAMPGRFHQDANGRFRITWTVPRRLAPIQDVGGGATTPGRYFFYTRPATCDYTPFEVTG